MLFNPFSLFARDTPSFALYMVLYDIFINQTEDQKGFSLFWAGGLAGNLENSNFITILIPLFNRDTPVFGLYMVLYYIFINQTDGQKGFSLFWAGGLAGN